MSAPRHENRLTPERAGSEQAARVPDEQIIEMGRAALDGEADALRQIGSRLDADFARAVRTILACRGRVLVTGLGKSGLIGRKIAATLTSTGTPALFVHPVEALHGDLGIATPSDLVLALSNSGHSNELNSLVGSLRALGLGAIVITGALNSPLAELGDVVLDATIEREVCPLNLTPTTSSTVALGMGDALTVCLLHLRDFRREDFAVFHPSGTLGRALHTTVADLMHGGDELPVVRHDQSLRESVLVIADKRLGCTCVVDDDGALIGFVTNGDLQRVLLRQGAAAQGGDPLDRPVSDFMSASPQVVAGNSLARSALEQMERNPRGPITQLVVLEGGRPVGVIHLHDILQLGLSR